MARLVEPGLHARRHHVRLGAQRLEERRALRAGRLHRDHPRQGEARGNARDRVAGAEVSARPLPGRARSRRGRDRLRLHPARAATRRRSSRASATRSSPGFDPDTRPGRVGCANQTTMLMTESLEIGEMFRAAMTRRATARRRSPQHFRAFDTICSATQERQDAVIALLERAAARPDAGGRAATTAATPATWRASAPSGCRRSTSPIPSAWSRPTRSAIGRSARRRPPSSQEGVRGWLPRLGPLIVGLTAGASTPNNIVGQVIERLGRFAASAELPRFFSSGPVACPSSSSLRKASRLPA